MGQLSNVTAVFWVATAHLREGADCTWVGCAGGGCKLTWVTGQLVHVGGWEMSGCGMT